MNNRPLILKGNIILKEANDYIIGKIIKNANVAEKKDYIQVLDDKNVSLFEKGYRGYIL